MPILRQHANCRNDLCHVDLGVGQRAISFSSLKCEVTPFRRSLVPHGSASVAVWCCAIRVTCTSFVRLSIVEFKFGFGDKSMPSNPKRKLGAVVARLQLQYGPTAVRKAAPREPVAASCPPPSPNWMARSAANYLAMALALADSLLERSPLDADSLARHFAAWYRTGPSDVGIQTSNVLGRIARACPGRRLSTPSSVPSPIQQATDR